MANNNNGMITQNELSDSLNKKIDDSDTNSKLNKQQIGSLPSLRTSSKDTLVNSINELFQYASNGKTLVANAITGKGVQSNSNMTFQQLATNISNIKTGYSREDLESGKVIVNLSFQKVLEKEYQINIYSKTVCSLNYTNVDNTDKGGNGYFRLEYEDGNGSYTHKIIDQNLNIVQIDPEPNFLNARDKLYLIPFPDSIDIEKNIDLTSTIFFQKAPFKFWYNTNDYRDFLIKYKYGFSICKEIIGIREDKEYKEKGGRLLFYNPNLNSEPFSIGSKINLNFNTHVDNNFPFIIFDNGDIVTLNTRYKSDAFMESNTIKTILTKYRPIFTIQET